ncbi:MAG: 30S ribosomal protein S5 [Patescibacteria group bacterium]|jgi:small subunit ribosomal protein S5
MERRRGKGRRQFKEAPDEFEQKIVDLARVTRVMAGGKRMRFRAAVVVGNKKGQVGIGVGKGADVAIAVDKATRQAKKNLINVCIVNDTIPHPVQVKYSAAKILLKPAPPGRGIIAGGPVRMVLELSGIKNIVSKMQGSNNKISNINAVIKGLQTLRTKDTILKMRQFK